MIRTQMNTDGRTQKNTDKKTQKNTDRTYCFKSALICAKSVMICVLGGI